MPVDLQAGYPLESPAVTVPWAVTVAELRRLLEPFGLREVTRGYHVVACESLGGLRHRLGFRFGTWHPDRLEELEIFRGEAVELHASFDEFQRHLEAAFGPPHRSSAGSAGFPGHEWRVPGAKVEHYVMERFGPEEHVRIQRRTA